MLFCGDHLVASPLHHGKTMPSIHWRRGGGVRAGMGYPEG